MQTSADPGLPDARRGMPMSRLTIRRTDVGLGLVLLVLGLLIVYGSSGLAYSARAGPGPGFLPRWLGIGLALAGFGLVMTRLRRRSGEEALELPERGGLARVGTALLLLVGLALTFQPLGFLLSTGAMIFVLLYVLERERPARALALATALPVASHLFFKVWLGVRLPSGLFGF